MDRMKRLQSIAVLVAAAASGQASAAPTAGLLPPCEAVQLSLLLDAGLLDFGGRPDRGTRLVVRNGGASACRIPGLPPVIFRDARGRLLPIERQIPPGMHPGPVVLPAAVPVAGEVKARLGWSSEDSLKGGRCYSPATIEITIGQQAISHPFQDSFCGSAGQPAKFTQGWFSSKLIKETAR